MNHVAIKMRYLILSVALAVTPLGACAMSNSQHASQELRLMKAGHYFSNRVQADFIAKVGYGDLEHAQRLLNAGAEVDAIGSDGMTALYWAIAKQSLTGFQFLLERGANPDTLTQWVDANGVEQWVSVIELAALLEDSRYLQALLDAGSNPNQIVNASQQTAIYTALLHERYKNASLLIKSGANLDHQSKSLTTPINRAVSEGSYASALFLLRAGADPKLKDRWGYSAIDTAKKFGDRGVVVGSADELAYLEFVAELKRRGLWDEPKSEP